MKPNMSCNSASISVVRMLIILLAGWLLLSSCDSHDSHEGEQGHDDHGQDEHGHDDHEEEVAKGPHGGRLLIQDGFSLEIAIYETGLPPEFHIYVYNDNQPVAPDKVTLEMELNRLGNITDHIKFMPRDDYLRGNTVVYEPHSFEVTVKATFEGESYSWHYDNFEGRTEIPDNMSKEMGIQTEVVGPLTLTETRTLTGRVQTNPNRLSRVRPRFPGVIKAIRHELGDVVRAGDILATVQSNESLQNYHVKAPIDGLIIKRDVQVG